MNTTNTTNTTDNILPPKNCKNCKYAELKIPNSSKYTYWYCNLFKVVCECVKSNCNK